MPNPGLGSSYTGWFLFNVAGPSVGVGANNYNDVLLPIPQLPATAIGSVDFILAQAPAVQAASPQLMISYVWLADATHIGVRWMNTTGGGVTVPAATYSIAILA